MSKTTAPTRRLGTVAQACETAAMSKPTLYRLLKSGEVQAFKRGDRTLIDLDSLDVHLNGGLKPWKPKEGHSEHMKRVAAQVKARKAANRETSKEA